MSHNHNNTIILNGKSDRDLKKAAEMLIMGQLVALPTETVYGLAGNGLEGACVRAIFHAKNRPIKNPVILHVKDLSSALKLFDSNLPKKTTDKIKLLATNFWPGPLTIVAKKATEVPLEVTAGKNSVAVRIPDHKVTLKILAYVDFPLAMPSANISSRPSPTTAEHVLITLGGIIPAVLDGGECEVGIESTVISLLQDQPKILRPGLIQKEAIESILNEKIIFSTKENKNPESPGQAFLHYKPEVKEIHLKQYNDLNHAWNKDINIILCNQDFLRITKAMGTRVNNTNLTLVLPDEVHAYGQRLYWAFYQAESKPKLPLWIITPKNHQESAWLSIMDRLKRATDTSGLLF